MKVQFISPAEFAGLFDGGGSVDVIDVSTPAEFREVHIAHAHNIPLARLDPAAVMQGRGADRPLYVVCRSGMRSRRACERFIASGFGDVVSVSGGIQECMKADMPIVWGRSGLSLERQVRLVVGTGVVSGVVLGWLVHPAFFVISAGMGTGLIFAGITDTCPLGIFLAALPWNRFSGGNGRRNLAICAGAAKIDAAGSACTAPRDASN